MFLNSPILGPRLKGYNRIATPMSDAALSDRLEYAILEIVFWNPSKANHQDYWGDWCQSIRKFVPDFTDADLLDAFKRLWKQNVVRLTKVGSHHADEYSGNESDDNWFFFRDPFRASITPEGRKHWNNLLPPKTSVFISHIGEEKDVAKRLQLLIQSAFSNAFPVFVSSDPESLGGGEEWYHHILDSLANAKVVLVLLSPESADRPWINFEAGFGKGRGSRVVPLSFRGLSFDALDYPLKGLQGYYLSQVADILNEVAKQMGVPMVNVDLETAWREIDDIQIDLPAKRLALEMASIPSYRRLTCSFYLVNNGNRDIEPLEVTVCVPSLLFCSPFNPSIDAAILEVTQRTIGDVDYKEITYRNYREPLMPNRHSKPERLVTCLAPGMKSKLRHISLELRSPLGHEDVRNPIQYRINAKTLKPVEGAISLQDFVAIGL